MRNSVTDEPSTFNQTLAENLCDRVAEGETLATICAEDAMPSLDDLKHWLRENSEFAGSLDQAILFRREHFLDKMIEIELMLLRGTIDVVEAEKKIERLKTLIDNSDMPVGIW